MGRETVHKCLRVLYLCVLACVWLCRGAPAFAISLSCVVLRGLGCLSFVVLRGLGCLSCVVLRGLARTVSLSCVVSLCVRDCSTAWVPACLQPSFLSVYPPLPSPSARPRYVRMSLYNSESTGLLAPGARCGRGRHLLCPWLRRPCFCHHVGVRPGQRPCVGAAVGAW